MFGDPYVTIASFLRLLVSLLLPHLIDSWILFPAPPTLFLVVGGWFVTMMLAGVGLPFSPARFKVVF